MELKVAKGLWSIFVKERQVLSGPTEWRRAGTTVGAQSLAW